MRLLRLTDYLRHIQSDNLTQIIEGNYNTLLDVEQSAQSEMISYLAQRYSTNKIFTDTSVFSTGTTYYGKNLIEYTAPDYVSSTTYSINDRAVYGGIIYISTSGSTGILPSTGTTSWSAITTDKSLYYAKLPAPEYVHTTSYSTGSIIWYEDKTYQALQTNKGILPDSDTNRWSASTTYSFIDVFPEDTTYWIKGDNRNQQIVMYLIDCVLYHLHSRINPRNIPELRAIRYDGANSFQSGGVIGWLKKVGSDDVTADLPKIIPQQGISIRWGSNTRNTNTY
jgi:hypothetical protein